MEVTHRTEYVSSKKKVNATCHIFALMRSVGNNLDVQKMWDREHHVVHLLSPLADLR